MRRYPDRWQLLKWDSNAKDMCLLVSMKSDNCLGAIPGRLTLLKNCRLKFLTTIPFILGNSTLRKPSSRA